MRRQRLRLGNFSKGMLRDSATDDERLLSLRTIKNYFISYDDGRLKVRNGYSRWNAVALADVAKQLFWFTDLSLNEHLLGIANDLWFKIAESGAHTQVSTEAATARRPIVQVGNRVFFGTDQDGSDIGFRWTDNTAIGATTSYRIGIVKPGNAPQISVADPIGQNTLYGTQEPVFDNAELINDINTTTRRKLAFQFVLTGSHEINAISVDLCRYHTAMVTGSLRVAIYTNNGGEPSSTLADVDAQSVWVPVSSFADAPAAGITYLYSSFDFTRSFTLSAGTYWGVIDADDSYYDIFANTLEDGPGVVGNSRFAATSYADTDGGDPIEFANSLRWNNGTSAWIEMDREITFFIGGIEADRYYDYVYTYVNSTYGIESRKSPYARITPSDGEVISIDSHTSSSDAQVDKIRIYRRQLDEGDDGTTADADVTDTYKFVAEITEGDTNFQDTKSQAGIGALLQTDDHYRFDETDDSGNAIRTSALLPELATYWKSRIWFAEANSNILHFSKILEQDGRTGLTADSIPDFYPLDNKLEFNETSDIIALKPITADELAVYFRNTSIWVLRGSDDVLNPPADIVRRRPITDVGLIAPGAVDSLRSRHVFVARKGVYTFSGISAIEYLSNGIQTILDEIADSSLDDSVVVALGDSVWIAVDEDETGDGKLNNIYILDIQREPATWRVYNYRISINDMVVRKTGTEYKTLLAADSDNNYILKLEDGNDDNGQAIVAEAETQDLIAPNLVTIFEVQIDAFYPNVAPLYEIQVTDALGETHDFELAPSAIDDLAGHKAYPIIQSAIGSRVKVTQRTVNQNHLRAIDIGYVEQ